MPLRLALSYGSKNFPLLIYNMGILKWLHILVGEHWQLIINLTCKEFDILLIIKSKGVFTYELYGQNLPNYIESVAGIGYKFKCL